jgi:hypothetical protein
MALLSLTLALDGVDGEGECVYKLKRLHTHLFYSTEELVIFKKEL